MVSSTHSAQDEKAALAQVPLPLTGIGQAGLLELVAFNAADQVLPLLVEQVT
jgi:hypothetical protein